MQRWQHLGSVLIAALCLCACVWEREHVRVSQMRESAVGVHELGCMCVCVTNYSLMAESLLWCCSNYLYVLLSRGTIIMLIYVDGTTVLYVLLCTDSPYHNLRTDWETSGWISSKTWHIESNVRWQEGVGSSLCSEDAINDIPLQKLMAFVARQRRTNVAVSAAVNVSVSGLQPQPLCTC